MDVVSSEIKNMRIGSAQLNTQAKHNAEDGGYLMPVVISSA